MPWRATAPGALTILRAPGKRLTKLITPAGIVGYDRASVFEVDAVRIECVEDLHELLSGVDERTAVIRGVLRLEFAGRPLVLRRSRPRPGVPERFAPAARSWLMVDVDGLPAPLGVDPCDPLVAGGALRRALPAPFRVARAVVQLSSTVGLEPGVIKGHLWYWLSRPITDAEAKRWLAAAPVDLALYHPIQLHYVANPIFQDVDDPVHERLAVLPGLEVVEVGVLPEPRRPAAMPAAPRPYTTPARGIGFKSTGPERYMLKCLRAIAEAPPTTRHPTFVRVAACLFGLAKGGQLDRAEVSARIQGAVALSSFDRDFDEVTKALRWAWESSTPWRLR